MALPSQWAAILSTYGVAEFDRQTALRGRVVRWKWAVVIILLLLILTLGDYIVA